MTDMILRRLDEATAILRKKMNWHTPGEVTVDYVLDAKRRLRVGADGYGGARVEIAVITVNPRTTDGLSFLVEHEKEFGTESGAEEFAQQYVEGKVRFSTERVQ